MREGGIECKSCFTPIHSQPFYRKMFGYKEGDFPVIEDVAGRTIALPFFNNLKEEQIDYVVEKLKEGIKLVVSKELVKKMQNTKKDAY